MNETVYVAIERPLKSYSISFIEFIHNHYSHVYAACLMPHAKCSLKQLDIGMKISGIFPIYAHQKSERQVSNVFPFASTSQNC